MKGRYVIAVCCAALALVVCGYVRTGVQARQVNLPTKGAAGEGRKVSTIAPIRISAEGTEAAEPAVATGGDGTVYVVWVEHRPGKEADVWLSHRDAEGGALTPPVRVNPKAGEATAWRGDAPTVAVAAGGTVYVGWTAREGGKGHGNILYLSASRDGGRSFEPPVKVHDDQKPGPHGMHTLAVAPDGRVHVAWLDERNVAPPPAREGEAHKHMESNREVFYASSSDGGRTFSANKLIAREVCPCCKTALAAGADGRVYVAWRQVLPGDFRHIAIASSADGGRTFSAPVVVSDDRWMIAGCPVSGAALLAEPDGALRVLWYTGGKAGPAGLYWSESRDGGRTFAPRQALAETGWRGTPALLGDEGGGFIAIWEGSGGASTSAMSAVVNGKGVVIPASRLAAGGLLPAAARAGGQVFVAYIAKGDAGQSIWLTRAGLRESDEKQKSRGSETLWPQDAPYRDGLGDAGAGGGALVASPAPSAWGAEERRYELTGVVKSVDRAKRRAVVEHEKVGDYMGAMTMQFPIKDAKALRVMQPGDQIKATLVIPDDGGMWLENITITARAAAKAAGPFRRR